MNNKSEYNRPWQWVAGIVFLVFLGSGCADMQQRPQPEPVPPPAPSVVQRHDLLSEYRKNGDDYVPHRVRPGETLSGIAMDVYDTYLTDVYYDAARRRFLTSEFRKARGGDGDIQRMGKVSDVIARLNGLDSDRVTVGSEILLPRIQGLPFRRGAPKKRKPREKAKPETAAPAAEKEGQERQERRFQDLLVEGRRYFEQNGYGAAITPLSAAHRLRPQDPTVRDYLARSYRALGETAYGKKEYLRAAEAFGHALRYNEACTVCREKKAESEARYKDLHYKNGIRYFENEQLVKAIEEWERVRKIDPDYENVQKNIALARRLLKRLREMESGKDG